MEGFFLQINTASLLAKRKEEKITKQISSHKNITAIPKQRLAYDNWERPRAIDFVSPQLGNSLVVFLRQLCSVLTKTGTLCDSY